MNTNTIIDDVERSTGQDIRPNPYQVLAQQVGLNYEELTTASLDYNTSTTRDYRRTSGNDSGIHLDTSSNLLGLSLDFTNQLSFGRRNTFTPLATSSPVQNGAPYPYDVPARQDVPPCQRQRAMTHSFAGQREESYSEASGSVTSFDGLSQRSDSATVCSAFESPRRLVPSFLPLQQAGFMPSRSDFRYRSQDVWSYQGEISASSASTPVSSAASTAFQSPLRRTISESLEFPPPGGYNRRNESFCASEWQGSSYENALVPPCYPPPRPRAASDIGASNFAHGRRGLFDPPYVWSGHLPLRDMSKNIVYSCKVFLGGVPWDTTEEMLSHTFQIYGSISVEWPIRDNTSTTPRGYVYIIFEHAGQVKHLLSACTRDPRDGGSYYYFVSSKRLRSKEVQVIPWILSDANYIPRDVPFPNQRLDTRRTVFVGALHGVITAEALYVIMNDIFGDVIHTGIDTDKYKYPIGSGRVTFSNFAAFLRAVDLGFVEVRTAKFTKKLQLDPYLEDSTCSKCAKNQGPYFCRNRECFRYYCRSCWTIDHPTNTTQATHKVIMRSVRNTIMRPTESF